MNVLSLFDGMSCGQQALERAGFKVDKYFASEIDKYAIQVTMANYPNTIQLGSVVNVNAKDLPKIDLLIGGSPCQSFSFAGKRKGMSTKDEQEILTLDRYLELKEQEYEFEGQSYLFWEYMRLLNEVKPKYFLLENVMMGEKWEKILSKAIGVKPIMINSSLVSAQNRQRLYWTNIGLEPQGLFGDLESTIQQPNDKVILLKDILEPEADTKYYLSEKMILNFGRTNEILNQDIIITHNLQKRSADRPALKENKNAGGSGHLSKSDGKTYCLDIGNTQAVEIFNNDRLNKTIEIHKEYLQYGTLIDSYNKTIHTEKSITISKRVNASSQTHIVGNKSKIRRLTPVECERLQTVKDNYTNYVSDSQRYKMLGNGWTVDVIAHILNYIK
jgi:DNA (cytosine-5)-methyltransferase 3A